MSREPSDGPKVNLLDRLAWLYATGCGIGMLPKAPGTWGSLLGPLVVFGWQSLERPMHEGVVVFLVSVLLGVGASQRTARRYGLSDPGCVVCDEIAAFAIVFVSLTVTWTTAILGFVWFRIFDIAKPWPISRLERLPGGWGIMADDLLAGVFAAAALHGTLWLLEFVR